MFFVSGRMKHEETVVAIFHRPDEVVVGTVLPFEDSVSEEKTGIP